MTRVWGKSFEGLSFSIFTATKKRVRCQCKILLSFLVTRAPLYINFLSSSFYTYKHIYIAVEPFSLCVHSTLHYLCIIWSSFLVIVMANCAYHFVYVCVFLLFFYHHNKKRIKTLSWGRKMASFVNKEVPCLTLILTCLHTF